MDLYFEHRRVADIERAAQCITTALQLDNDYGLAIYYKGVVSDLMGKPADAPAYFNRLLKECESKGLEMEAVFNLGVVYYHRYSHRYLEQAHAYFSDVLTRATDDGLKCQAKAHLAQTHAMWMRPSHAQLPDKRQDVPQQVRDHIERHFQLCRQIVEELRNAGITTPRTVATFENANGMANMYYTDHVARGAQARALYLSAARDSLDKANSQLPNDWANTCDLGSLQLRLGVLARDSGEANECEDCFAIATGHLTRVADELRPGYGFALYELGIVHRVWRKWNESDGYLSRAMAVPEDYRDISDSQVAEQRGRVAQTDDSYP